MNFTVPEIDWDLRTGNVDLVRSKVSGLLRPFRLKTDPRKSYDARLFGRQFAHTGIAIIDYGQEVDVEADPMHSFSLIQIPIRGSFELNANGKSSVVNSTEAHLLGPATPLRMHWSPDCRLLVVRLDDGVTRKLVANCRRSAPILFSGKGPGTVLAIDRGPGLSLFRIVSLMRDEALANGAIPCQRRLVDSIEDLLVRLLIYTLEPTGKDAAPDERSTDTRILEQAKAFMSANLDRPISTSEVATACGVSSRTLFLAFRKSLHIGPHSWLTEQRLDKVRESLTEGPAYGKTVTEIAMKWGFNHLGRFSASYRQRFGENPSETLRRHTHH